MEGQVLNISPVVVWVIALSQLLTFGLTIWNLMASGSRANAKKIEDHAKRLDGHELRLGSVEQAQDGQLRPKDLHELALEMEELKGDMKAMAAAMTGHTEIMKRLEIIVARHEDHLLGRPR